MTMPNNRLPTKIQDVPLFRLGIGIILIVLWIVFSSFSILTTEDLIKRGHGGSFVLSWQCLTQLWDLMNGNIHGDVQTVAVLGAWGVYILLIATGIAEIVTPDERGEDKFFKTVCLIILSLDAFANYNYLRILPWEYQWLVSIMCTFVIVVCGKKGAEIALSAIGDIFS
jgi:hypothetical protein